MKKIFLAVFLSAIFIDAQAQTEKGDWLIGGRLDLNTGENSTFIGFSPGGGIFVINNLAVGGNIAINYQKSGDTKFTSFGVGPFARYYFGSSQVRPLLHGSVSYLSTKSVYPGFTSTNTGTNLFIGGGVAIFINSNVSIEGLAGYSRTKYKDFAGSGGFNLGIGFQVYLSKRQVEDIRGK